MTDRRSARLTRRRLLSMGAGLAGAMLLGACDDLTGGGSTASPSVGPVSGTLLDLQRRSQLPSPSNDELRLGGVVEGSGALLPAEELLVYSRLVGFDPRQPSVYMDLAREIEFVEPLVLRMRLDSGARFHPDNGSASVAVDAAAVQRDFERRKSENHYLFTEVIDEIETPAADTLVLHLRAPFALLFELLARHDASIRSTVKYAGIDVPLGSGAFVPVQTGPAGRAFQRHEAWHGGTPALAALSVRFGVGDPELDAAFLREELDVRVHPNAESREAVAERQDAVRVMRASRRQRGLGLSLLGRKETRNVAWVEAFQDQRVRRAISLGLDRRALLELDGSAPTGPVGPAHAGDALPLAELQAHELLQHNPEEARALLDAAGAVDLEFRVQHMDTAGILPVARLVVEQLREAGFAPRAMAMPAAEWETAFLRGDFEACVFELAAMETPDLGLRLHTSEGLNGQFSLWGYSNPVYDAAVRDALSEIDPARRAERAREAQRLLLEDVPAMFPLAAPREHASLAPNVRGYEFGAYEFNTAYLSAAWYREDTVPSE